MYKLLRIQKILPPAIFEAETLVLSKRQPALSPPCFVALTVQRYCYLPVDFMFAGRRLVLIASLASCVIAANVETTSGRLNADKLKTGRRYAGSA